MRNLITAVLFATLIPAAALAQTGGPSVEMAPAAVTPMLRGKPSMVELNFRVKQGFHINSNHPNSPYLIPTILKLDAPTDIAIGKMDYPAGRDLTFAFAPDEKLNVYSGDFAVKVTVHPLHTVTPGKYNVRGQLRYQACDDRACYPPRNLPVHFEVQVKKPAAGARPNRQSPHVHN
ncbi:MAG TPA: protein-disulfide reductase DsbD domain-containing protein [Terriglobales bacterium]|nr:protein-disulfide reductase DsbD domain-containing protein [Terriglobales bacterium]